MSHYGHNFAWLQRLAGAHHLLDERPAARAMQHLRQRGFQARAFSGRQDYDCDVGICHACIFSVSSWNNNPRSKVEVRIEYFIEQTQERRGSWPVVCGP
jgi:hypothetical protein